MRCDCCPLSDPIDRNAAIEALRKLAEDCPGSSEAATAAAMAISVISRLPSQQEKEATHETMAER